MAGLAAPGRDVLPAAGEVRPGWLRSPRSHEADDALAVGAVSVAGPPSDRRAAMHEASLSDHRRAPDTESLAWLQALSGAGRAHDDALERLHVLLLRASRFEVARRRRAVGAGGGGEADDLATQAADDALMAIMAKLHTYRGDSRFTTWAYKFALLEAAVKVRRRAWHGREVPLEADGWAQLADRRASPGADAETAELLRAVRAGIAHALTPHQRDVLVALTLNDVPIDVLAERLATTRGALYKTLHDARRKLRARLAEDGLAPDPTREGGMS
jgi:RNA polymerase sigma-70 factor (ECF subfamily)